MVPYYYPRVIERINTALIDVFNDVQINRFNEDGTISKIIDVPIIPHYSKNFAEYIINTNRVKESRYQTPIMGLRITGLNRDAARITQQKYIRKIYNEANGQYLRDRRPSPWKIGFTLSIYTENLEDFSQLIENIITYFDPTLTLSIKEFEKVNIERDIIVTLNDPNLEMNDEVDREDHQSYSIDLPLTASCVFYPPLSTAAVVKFISTNVNTIEAGNSNNLLSTVSLGHGWSGNVNTGFAHTVGNNTALGQLVSCIVGNTYSISILITSYTSGSIICSVGGFTSDNISSTYNKTFIASANNSLRILPSLDFDGTVIVSLSEGIRKINPVSTIQNNGTDMSIGEYNTLMPRLLTDAPQAYATTQSAKQQSVDISSLDESVIVSDITRLYEDYATTIVKYDSSAVIPIYLAKKNETIVYVELIVGDSFNSPNTTISIGSDANPELIMKASENSPYYSTKYAISFEYILPADTQINLYYHSSNSTKGEAQLTLAWKQV